MTATSIMARIRMGAALVAVSIVPAVAGVLLVKDLHIGWWLAGLGFASVAALTFIEIAKGGPR